MEFLPVQVLDILPTWLLFQLCMAAHSLEQLLRVSAAEISDPAGSVDTETPEGPSTPGPKPNYYSSLSPIPTAHLCLYDSSLSPQPILSLWPFFCHGPSAWPLLLELEFGPDPSSFLW